jgi:antitoxin FitA
MPAVTVRNIPEEVHRAIRLRAAQHGHSVEAEMRQILHAAAKPQGRVKLGSFLAEVGRTVRLTDEEFATLQSAHDQSPARAASFE